MEEKFIETKIETKFGEFVFRAYSDKWGKETVVLYKENIDLDKPFLVRVHGECMTGDLFKSYKCDCGPQLEASLRMIDKNNNGALIYLRQEGRGIGLFKKIKSYILQKEGYDTFEANVMLGHDPDERTYEWAKTALDDLGVKEIKLITNNPSKVSEVAKMGIKVTERIPVLIKSNKFNKKYFETKKNKFKHFLDDNAGDYFYQFHAEKVEHVEKIGEFLKNEHNDPLLKICVGVAASPKIFDNESEVENIKNIFKSCSQYENFVPILHFTFRDSIDTQKDLKRIKKELSFVEYLQTNDLPHDDLPAIKLACKLFLADIPLWDENFDLLVDDDSFRKAIKKNKAFLLLDNSKGKGIQEEEESLIRKIDKLLDYGLNDIAIFGGFGPDALDMYFKIRRYYKINFSIDAESRLKTGKEIDLNKTKIYLKQLLRFSDPNKAGIDQTKDFLQKNKTDSLLDVSFDGIKFKVYPDVFNSQSFPSTKWFADELKDIVKEDKSFCEIGCGCGVISCIVASNIKDIKVVATDISPSATENTILNVDSNKLDSRIDVYNGDVFDGIPVGQKFDSIFWALPFGFMDPGSDLDYVDMQFFDPGYRAIRKFLQEGRDFLNENGSLYLGFSETLGNKGLLEDIASENDIKLEIIRNTNLKESEEADYQIIKATYL